MASLVLGGLGGLMFGPIGFLAGSLLGNLLFPQKQEGPRLSNLKLQGSSYGQMIPIPYGTIRLAGQVVWQTDLTEHKHTSGGKGGPQVTTFSYTDSFAVKICKGPIIGIARIWANGEVIYDTTGTVTVDNSAVPITIYTGVETANPDPTMESILGVGKVPAFRDDAAVVFTDWDLGHFGNTLPQLSFEVFATGGVIPYRVSTWTVPQSEVGGGTNGVCAVANAGNIDIVQYTLAGGATSGTFKVTTYDLQGNIVATPFNQSFPTLGGSSACSILGSPNSYICFIREGGIGNVPGSGGWLANGVIVASSVTSPDASFQGFYAVDSAPVYLNGNVYAVSGRGYLTRWPAPGGIPQTAFDASYLLPGYSNGHGGVILSVGDDGNLYAATWDPLNNSFIALLKFDPALNLLFTWHSPQSLTPPYPPANLTSGNRSFVIWNNNSLGVTTLGGSKLVWADSLASNIWSPEGPMLPVSLTPNDAVSLGNGYAVVADGVVSLIPPSGPVLLSTIVADISTRSGLSGGDIDVTQLTDLVDGYLITTRADARTDIDQLRTAYFFDAVESQGLAKFVKRGQQPIVTIPDNDLAAQQMGGKPPPLVELARAQEIDLPAQVNLKYLNKDAWYQDGSQQAIRQATISQSVSDVSLAIAMSDLKARQIANVLLYQTIVERESAKFITSRQYLYLEPTDVISAHGYTIRIEKKTSTVAGLVEFEGKLTLAALYFVLIPANAGSGALTPPVIGASQATQLVLMDLPLINDLDDQGSFYAAMAGAKDNTWRGATLYRSVDGGATYSQIAADSIASIIGTASNALPFFGGGNMFDESNSVSVVVGLGGGTLAGTTSDAVLNGGANFALIGDEMLQFKNALLTAPSTYQLSGLLRGRRGTERHMSTHKAGEQFVLLSPIIGAPDVQANFGILLDYKAVTTGSTLAATALKNFLDGAMRLAPYSPVQLGGGVVTTGGNVQLNWIRRTRIGGAWNEFTDVPLSEASELYVLQIWDSTYTFCARVVTGLTSPTFIYTSAMQVTDFGANQKTIFYTVGQIGSYGLGVQSFGSAPGVGGSNSSVISPVPPYNTLPPSPPPATGCSGTVSTTTVPFGSSSSVLSPSNFAPGITWVIKFTTPSSFSYIGTGRIQAAEYGGQPAGRNTTFSDQPCGNPLIPAAQNTGFVNQMPSVQFNFGANPTPQIRPTLLPSTTYYWSITTQAPSPMIASVDFFHQQSNH